MAADAAPSPIDAHLRHPWRERQAAADRRGCGWPGCEEAGTHRAPASRERLREFRWFCLAHVREYNRQWDFFAGMTEAEIEAHRRADVTWHRPTWRLGTAWRGAEPGAADPFGFFADMPRRPPPAEERPSARTVAMMAVLGLAEGFSGEELKRRFKILVKRFHPDLHGGDKVAGERLRAVIEAYRHLREESRRDCL